MRRDYTMADFRQALAERPPMAGKQWSKYVKVDRDRYSIAVNATGGLRGYTSRQIERAIERALDACGG